jgi:hypothetical protein
MRFVVIGPMRSGTSMLMRMCEAGGMSVLKSTWRDATANAVSVDGFQLNPESLYEPDLRQDIGAQIAALPEGTVAKLVYPWLDHLPMGQAYRVVHLHRDAEELRQCWAAARLGPPPTAARIAEIRDWLRAHPSIVSVTDLTYHEVVLNPEAAVQMLQRDGWPLTDAAAAIVEPAMYVMRNPDLWVPPHPDHSYLTVGL